MYMRVVQANVNPQKITGFQKVYNKEIIPELQEVAGCLCARLMQSTENQDEFVSMTLWDTQEHVEAYEQSGLFQKLLDKAKPFFSESSEWKIQLSEDFTLKYVPAEEEPIVKSYPVVEQSNSEICADAESRLMYMRVVSVKIQPGKMEEFKRIYKEKNLPAVRAVRGCRYAYLAMSVKERNKLFSVTIWNTKEDAENYERSGLFDELTENVKHTLSELYQWKLGLEKEYGKKLATSEDLKVNYYNIVTGSKFR